MFNFISATILSEYQNLCTIKAFVVHHNGTKYQCINQKKRQLSPAKHMSFLQHLIFCFIFTRKMFMLKLLYYICFSISRSVLGYIRLQMPARKGLLAPQNTFLDTIATRFDGTRKYLKYTLCILHCKWFTANVYQFLLVPRLSCIVAQYLWYVLQRY